MSLGIERLSLYTSPFYVDALELAVARGRDLSQIRDQVMIEQRSVVPPYEDAVTLAVNAACALTPTERQQIGLLIVGSESGVDFGKPISTWVHRFCGLPSDCRNFELKHACYSGTGALMMALSWLASGAARGRKALVISADVTTPGSRSMGVDFIGGGCAAALLISDAPQMLEINPNETGYWTQEIADTFRPTPVIEIGDNQSSLFSYLDALDGSFENYLSVTKPVDFQNHFKKHIYHAPFPGMTFRAHSSMLSRLSSVDKSVIRESFQDKVEPGLYFAKRTGSAYGASNFLCLLGLMRSSDLQFQDRISVFAYGSGCQGEFYGASVGPQAHAMTNVFEYERLLNERRELSVEEYDRLEDVREAAAGVADFEPSLSSPRGAYGDLYKGQNRLVLKRIERYRRIYDWS